MRTLEWVTYCSIWLNWAVQLHGRSTFLDYLGIFPMKTSLLVLLHPSDLFLKPVKAFVKIESWTKDLSLTSSLLSCLCQRHQLEPNCRQGLPPLQWLVGLAHKRG